MTNAAEQRGQVVTKAVVCERAALIVEREGAAALTIRRVASELKVTAKTVHQRIGNRDNLIRLLANDFAQSLNAMVCQQPTWKSTAMTWCLNLHQALITHPHLVDLLEVDVMNCVAGAVEDLVQVATQEGLSRKRAVSLSRALAKTTIDGALAELRAPRSADEADAGMLADAAPPSRFVHSISVILEDVGPSRHTSRSASRPDPSKRKSRPRQSTTSDAVPMTRAEQASFAWSLAELGKPLLAGVARDRLNAHIGAGDFDTAIAELLRCFVANRCALPHALTARCQAWAAGYQGSDAGAELQRLVDRLQTAAASTNGHA